MNALRLLRALPALALPVTGANAVAQVGAEEWGSVTGLAFDSLAMRPLAGAVVSVTGAGRRATTGEDGRFLLALPPGRHLIELEHPAVPSWSVVHHAVAVELEPGRTEDVIVATASEATALARACGDPAGVVVGGAVLDMLTRVPLARAVVRIESVSGEERRELARVPTSLAGEYRHCAGALPPGRVEIEARMAGRRSRAVAVDPEGRRVVARDVNLLLSEPARVSGVVIDAARDEPVADARIRVESTRLAVVSGADGRFLIRGVPPGAVRLEVEHARFGRQAAEILAGSGDSVHVEIGLHEGAVPLEELVVRVRRPRSPERVRSGTRFDELDRARIEELLGRADTFAELLRLATFPGVNVQDDGASLCVEAGRRGTALAGRCEMVEVFLNDVRLGNPAAILLWLEPETIERVRLLSPMEARVGYGQVASRNGALLIYTRGNG